MKLPSSALLLPALALLAGGLACSLSGDSAFEASRPVAVTVPLAGDRPLVVDLRAGRLRLRPGEGPAAEATATLHVRGSSQEEAEARLERVTLVAGRTGAADSLTLEGPAEARDWDWSVELELRVPPGTVLRLDLGAGEVDLEGPWPEVACQTGAGRVRYRGAARDLVLETGAGEVEVELPGGWSGRGRVRTGAGEIVLRCAGRLACPVQAVATLGRVEVRGPAPGTLLDADASLPEDASLRLEAGVGSVTIQQSE